MRKREFTPEQVEFIRNGLQTMSTRKVAEAYTMHFGEALGQTQLRRVCDRHGIVNPRPENKPLPVGYERWDDYYQCYVVKVAQISVKGMKPSPERKRLRGKQWQLKQNAVWEQANGRKLTSDLIVVFLDGDRTNYDPDNLYAVPLEVIGYCYRTKINSEFAPVMKSALKCAELAHALSASIRGSKMPKYCRYCSHMVCGDANYCEVKKRTYSDSFIKHTNDCEHFVLNPIDALFENKSGYKPRPSSTNPEQITWDEVISDEDLCATDQEQER